MRCRLSATVLVVLVVHRLHRCDSAEQALLREGVVMNATTCMRRIAFVSSGSTSH